MADILVKSVAMKTRKLKDLRPVGGGAVAPACMAGWFTPSRAGLREGRTYVRVEFAPLLGLLFDYSAPQIPFVGGVAGARGPMPRRPDPFPLPVGSETILTRSSRVQGRATCAIDCWRFCASEAQQRDGMHERSRQGIVFRRFEDVQRSGQTPPRAPAPSAGPVGSLALRREAVGFSRAERIG